MFIDGWMPIPQAIPQNCPNGLQYLSTINQLLVKQKVEVLEGIYDLSIIYYINIPKCQQCCQHVSHQQVTS